MSLRNVCTVCEGTSFENIDGFYFCLICGTKAQVRRYLADYSENIYPIAVCILNKNELKECHRYRTQ